MGKGTGVKQIQIHTPSVQQSSKSQEQRQLRECAQENMDNQIELNSKQRQITNQFNQLKQVLKLKQKIIKRLNLKLRNQRRFGRRLFNSRTPKKHKKINKDDKIDKSRQIKRFNLRQNKVIRKLSGQIQKKDQNNYKLTFSSYNQQMIIIGQQEEITASKIKRTILKNKYKKQNIKLKQQVQKLKKQNAILQNMVYQQEDFDQIPSKSSSSS